MILDCPACGARYRLPDNAIPPEGKTVRCARCKHSWVELGQPLDDRPLDDQPPDDGSLDSDPPAYAAALDKLFAASPGAASAIAVSSAASSSSAQSMSSVPLSTAASAAEATAYGSPPDPPAHRRWPWLVLLLLVIALALGAAAVLTRAVALPPQLASQLDLPVLMLPAIDLPQLDLTRIPLAGQWLDHRLNPPALPPMTLTLQASADFHQLDNGSRMLALTGSVANPTDRQQTVPEIEALVLDASRRPVYRWRIPAPLVALPPRTAAPFDSSASGYPASGISVTLRFNREP